MERLFVGQLMICMAFLIHFQFGIHPTLIGTSRIGFRESSQTRVDLTCVTHYLLILHVVLNRLIDLHVGKLNESIRAGGLDLDS